MVSLVRIGGGDIDKEFAVRDCANLIRNNNEQLIVVVGAHSALEKKLTDQGIELPPYLTPIVKGKVQTGHDFRYTTIEYMMNHFLPEYAKENEAIRDLLMGTEIPAESFYGENSLVYSRRAQVLTVMKERKRMVIRNHYGGDVTGVDYDKLSQVFAVNVVPVLSAPTWDKEEQTPINSDNDKIAAIVLKELISRNPDPEYRAFLLLINPVFYKMLRKTKQEYLS